MAATHQKGGRGKVSVMADRLGQVRDLHMKAPPALSAPAGLISRFEHNIQGQGTLNNECFTTDLPFTQT